MLRQLARSILQHLPESIPAIVLSGPLRGARWLVRSGNASYWLGTYEIGIQELLCSLLRPGQVFYDVGAHAGFYALLGARLVGPLGKVAAFEPYPRNAANLRRNVALNRLRNVSVIEAAVAHHTGDGVFEEGEDSYVGHLSSAGRIPVSVISLDDYTQRVGFVPSVIKIDAEGAERLVIQGAKSLLRSAHPALIVAVHLESEAPIIASDLEASGYDVSLAAEHTWLAR